jgi:hypothetical protein
MFDLPDRLRTKHRAALLGAIALLAIWATVESTATFVLNKPIRDFYSFYDSAVAGMHGEDMYAPHVWRNLNAPHISLLVFGGLTWLPSNTAAILWFALSCSMIAASVAILVAELRLPGWSIAWVIVTLFASAPMQNQWRQGQMGGVLMLLGTLAWRASKREQGAWWLAALISLKPWMACWLPVLPMRTAARTVLIGCLGLVVGVLVTGPAQWVAWVAALRADAVWPYASNVGLFGSLARLSGQQATSSTAAPWVWPAWWLLAGVLSTIAWRQRHSSHAWLVFGLTGFLLSPIAWAYYLLVLVAPFVAWITAQRRHRPAVLGLAFLCVPYRFRDLWAAGALLVWWSIAKSAGSDQQPIIEQAPAR